MTIRADIAAIETRFATEFAILRPSAPIDRDNVTFTPSATPWVRISVSPGGSNAASVGVSHYRDTGVVFVQIFTELGQGAGTAQAIADDVVSIFRGISLTALSFLDPVVVRVGHHENHYQMNVRIPYRSDKFV